MALKLVLDATPLIHLGKIGFWKDAGPSDFTLFTTPWVMSELQLDLAGVQTATVRALVTDGKLRIETVDALVRVEGLSPADVSVVLLAKRLGAVAVLDDRLARNYAFTQGVKTVYSSSLLIDAVRNGVWTSDEGKQQLDALVSSGWYCTVLAYQRIRKAIDASAVDFKSRQRKKGAPH